MVDNDGIGWVLPRVFFFFYVEKGKGPKAQQIREAVRGKGAGKAEAKSAKQRWRQSWLSVRKTLAQSDIQGSNVKEEKDIEMRVSGCVALLQINSRDRRHFHVTLALW